MKNCSNDILNYHQSDVTLPPAVRDAMRENRNANRRRLKRGLESNGDPQAGPFIIQGSYAMKTMTKHAENDYDIDDGAPFDTRVLVNDDGASMTAQQAKKMICDALIEGGGLPEDPKVKKNCVRVRYAAGHHIDIPVYRVSIRSDGGETRELAGETWRESNPTEISDWYRGEEKQSHADAEGEPQLRRQVRLLKRYSRSNLEGNALSD